MKLKLVVLLGALTACHACDIKDMMWVANPNLSPAIASVIASVDSKVEEICQDGGVAFINELKALIGGCVGEAVLDDIQPVFDLIEENLCLKEDSEWCLPSLLAMVPVLDLATKGYTPNLNYTQALDSEDHLNLICRTDGCMKKISHNVVEKLRKEKLDAPQDILDIVTKAGTTCRTPAVRRCSAGFRKKFLTDEDAPDPNKVCEDGQMKKCFQFVAPQWGFPDPCKDEDKSVDETIKTLVEAVFAIPDIALLFFEAHKDDIAKFLVEDLQLNIPGLVGDHLSLDLTVVEDGGETSLQVSFKISGTESFERDFSVGEAVEALKALWAKGEAFFPNTNVMAMGLVTTDKLVAPVMQKLVVLDTTTTPNPQDGTGSSSSASLSMSLFASAGAVFLAVLLAM